MTQPASERGSPPDTARGPQGTTTGPKHSHAGDVGGLEDAELPGPGGGEGVAGGDGEVAGGVGLVGGDELGKD